MMGVSIMIKHRLKSYFHLSKSNASLNKLKDLCRFCLLKFPHIPSNT